MPTLHGHPVALWLLKGPELGTSVPTVDTVSVSGFNGQWNMDKREPEQGRKKDASSSGDYA